MAPAGTRLDNEPQRPRKGTSRFRAERQQHCLSYHRLRRCSQILYPGATERLSGVTGHSHVYPRSGTRGRGVTLLPTAPRTTKSRRCRMVARTSRLTSLSPREASDWNCVTRGPYAVVIETAYPTLRWVSLGPFPPELLSVLLLESAWHLRRYRPQSDRIRSKKLSGQARQKAAIL
jgi:hypothetical protein